nr:MAG TPA: hypothetical protein [Caudoviricetes sp.]
MLSLLHAEKFVSVRVEHNVFTVRRDKAPVIIPATVHPLCVQRNAVNAITGKQEVVIDLELSLCCGRGLRKGRNERPSPSAPFLAGLRSAAFKCLIRNVRLECNNDLVEARDRRNLLSCDGKSQIRSCHLRHAPSSGGIPDEHLDDLHAVTGRCSFEVCAVDRDIDCSVGLVAALSAAGVGRTGSNRNLRTRVFKAGFARNNLDLVFLKVHICRERERRYVEGCYLRNLALVRAGNRNNRNGSIQRDLRGNSSGFIAYVVSYLDGYGFLTVASGQRDCLRLYKRSPCCFGFRCCTCHAPNLHLVSGSFGIRQTNRSRYCRAGCISSTVVQFEGKPGRRGRIQNQVKERCHVLHSFCV